VHRLTGEPNHLHERKIEQCPQGRQCSLLMPRCRPYAELSSRGGKGIGENKSALLWKPKRCLITTTTVIDGNEPSRKLAPRVDPLQFGFGNVVGKEEPGAKRTRMIAAHERIYVPNVIRLETTIAVG